MMKWFTAACVLMVAVLLVACGAGDSITTSVSPIHEAKPFCGGDSVLIHVAKIPATVQDPHNYFAYTWEYPTGKGDNEAP